MKRDIRITVSYEQKTMEVWIDGIFKFCDKYKYAENAVQAANAYADQCKHHSPLLTIDTCGYKTTDPFTLQAQRKNEGAIS